VDAALSPALALLRETAHAIDAAPHEDHRSAALRARLAAEAACEAVLYHVTRALGAGPLCHDPYLARAIADLPVFLRQSHAERDQAVLAQWLHNMPEPSWLP
ncbi:MAG: acyl-CoA dehydrogenase, partial [Rhodocyclaceae bacterium]